jgi:hypothetical protein
VIWTYILSCISTVTHQGAKKVGFTPEKIPRNVKSCVDCGHCCHGCPYESKQSTATALMEPLLLAGSGLPGQAGEGYRLQVIPYCHVSKVLYENVPGTVSGADGVAHGCSRRAVGVEATVKVYPDNFPDMSVKDRLNYICRGTEIKRCVVCYLLFLFFCLAAVTVLFACCLCFPFVLFAPSLPAADACSSRRSWW